LEQRNTALSQASDRLKSRQAAEMEVQRKANEQFQQSWGKALDISTVNLENEIPITKPTGDEKVGHPGQSGRRQKSRNWTFPNLGMRTWRFAFTRPKCCRSFLVW